MSATAPAALLPRLQVLAAAALFSTGGAAVKATTLSAWQVASFRSGIAAVALAMVFLLRRRGARGFVSPRIIAVGLAYATALGSYVVANKLTTAAATIFLVSTSPLWILVLSPWTLGERVAKRDLALIAMLALGMLLVLAAPAAPAGTAPNPRLGNWIAAGSGLAWALTVIGLRGLGRAPSGAGASETASAAHAVIWGNALAFALVLPLALPVDKVATLDLGVVAYLGLVQIALAYVLLLAGLRHVRALEASLLLILEPVLNPLWAWLVHSEAPPGATLAGGAVILAALAAHAWRSASSTAGS